MPQPSVGDTVTYEGFTLVVHSVQPELELVTCVYKGKDNLLHSVQLNVNLLKKKTKSLEVGENSGW